MGPHSFTAMKKYFEKMLLAQYGMNEKYRQYKVNNIVYSAKQREGSRYFQKNDR